VSTRATFALIVFVALITIPGSYEPLTGGIDPSWIWGLNAFPDAGFRWGRDLIFSYGPLGYLAHPLDVGKNLQDAVLIQLGVHAAVFGTVGLVFTRRKRIAPVLLFLTAYPVLFAFGLEFDYQLMATSGLLASAAIELSSGALLVLSAAAASLLLFIKFGSGVAAITMLIVAGTLWLKHRLPVKPLALATVAYLLVASLLDWYFVGSARGMMNFLSLSASLARGYNDAMSITPPYPPLLAAYVLLGLTVAVTYKATKDRLAVSLPLLIFAGPLVFAFKHSFVRADWGHIPFFFGLLWWATIAAVLFATERRAKVISLLLLASNGTLFSATADRAVMSQRAGAIVDVVTGMHAAPRLAALIDFRATRKDVRHASGAYVRVTDRLPEAWRQEIGRRSVLVLPWELGLCPANDLVCVPYPTLQMYATLTRHLDLWTAGRLRNQAPEYAIVDVDAIDGRNMLWDCPETWLALMERWEVVRRATDRPRLLLRRREAKQDWTEDRLESGMGQIGDWIDVPRAPGPVRVAIDLHESISGWLRRTFFRSDPVVLQVTTESGNARAYRIVVDTARSGLLIDAMPRRSDELADLFDCCRTTEPVRRIRLTGPGVTAFDQGFSITWSQLRGTLWVRNPTSKPYAKPRLVAGDPLMSIDIINNEAVAAAKNPLVVRDTRGIIDVAGWAVDREALAPANGVVLRWDDGRIETHAEYGLDRKDVAAYFGVPAYQFSGYSSTVFTDELGPGRHRLAILVISADGKTYRLARLPIEIETR